MGTTYGGDGRTNFALPDLRGRVAIHQGNGSGLTQRALGQLGGAETVTLTEANIPAHNHSLRANTAQGNSPEPTDNILALNKSAHRFSNLQPNTALADNAIDNSGDSQAHENMQPFAVINFIIAVEGSFPSRS